VWPSFSYPKNDLKIYFHCTLFEEKNNNLFPKIPLNKDHQYVKNCKAIIGTQLSEKSISIEKAKKLEI